MSWGFSRGEEIPSELTLSARHPSTTGKARVLKIAS